MDSTKWALEDEVKLPDSCSKKLYIECICPRCGVRHKMNLRWIGRGVPRKYCDSCLKNALRTYIEDVHMFRPPLDRMLKL